MPKKAPPENDPLFFTPVPLARRRANGWNAEAQRAFIAQLAQCGIVSTAAQSIGRTARSAYQLRNRPGAESFGRAWDFATEIGLCEMRDRAMAAINGEKAEPLYRHGRRVGTRIKPDLRLMFAALAAFQADKEGIANRMPHRQRLSIVDFQELMARPDLHPAFDRGAVELPWFDGSAIYKGRDALDLACREARMVEAALGGMGPPSPAATLFRERAMKSPIAREDCEVKASCPSTGAPPRPDASVGPQAQAGPRPGVRPLG